MDNYPRPIAIVSRYFGFEPCRCNGDTIDNPSVGGLKGGEVMRLLPRTPVEDEERLIGDRTLTS